ncbi:MAG: 4-(cytidine 5'-diphospho)-2-C-methyl-D-erythritol kinase [Bacteroidales bacterium]|nr:4-(cytidine 5'-diphospho)-2-C-methyl-D-erythritol kinase [Bacteroidales bacterium]
MIVFPNAKINIGLNIIEKRPDGFHNIESIFYPIELADCLEILESNDNQDNFETLGIDIPNDGKPNLVMRALNLLRQYYTIPYLNIKLIKKIPTGAGLGGGSSDAAFFINAVNDLCNLNISNQQKIEIASKLGSDCAFFINNKPVFASGTGNIFREVDFLDSKYKIEIIKPDFSISTPFAYSKVKPQKPLTNLLDDYKQSPINWKNVIKNDFEKFLFPEFPILNEYKQKLYNQGAIYASMTGSGSAFFGIFEK